MSNPWYQHLLLYMVIAMAVSNIARTSDTGTETTATGAGAETTDTDITSTSGTETTDTGTKTTDTGTETTDTGTETTDTGTETTDTGTGAETTDTDITSTSDTGNTETKAPSNSDSRTNDTKTTSTSDTETTSTSDTETTSTSDTETTSTSDTETTSTSDTETTSTSDTETTSSSDTETTSTSDTETTSTSDTGNTSTSDTETTSRPTSDSGNTETETTDTGTETTDTDNTDTTNTETDNTYTETEVSTTEPKNTLKILFLNDLSYNILPLQKDSSDICYEEEQNSETTNCVGGIHRLYHYLETNRDNYDLILNAGNTVDLNLFATLKFGPIEKAMELLDFTAIGIGPNLFNFGADPAVSLYLNLLGNTVVASNLGVLSTKYEFTSSITLSLNDKLNISVIGFIDSKIINNANPYGVTVTDELTAIKDQVTKLKESNQNVFIVAIGSTSEEISEQMLSSTGVDLVIPVISEKTLDPPPTDPKETLFERNSSDSLLVTVIKTSTFPFLLGDLSIELDENNAISDYSAQVIDYSESETTTNSTVLEFVASTLQKQQDLFVSLLAVSDVPLNATNGICNNQECTLGNTVTDSIMWYTKRNQNNAAIAVYPGGGFQNTLISEGTNITGKMVETLFVRDAYLYQISLTGRQVKQLFEVSAQSIDKGNKNEDWLQVSNAMSVMYDTSQASHRRVVSVQTMVPPAGQLSSIDLTSDSEKHAVLVPASMLSTDSYSFLKTSGTDVSVLSVSVVDVMKLYLQANNYLISDPLGRRITYKYSSSDQPTVKSKTGIVVLVTLIITALVAGGGYMIWKYLLPRYRARSSSTIQLVESSRTGNTYGL